MLIDVTRLADRMLQGRLPTGVDRVSLAYVQHFKDSSRALLRFAGRWLTFTESDSQRLFDALLGGEIASAHAIRWYVARAYVFSWSKHPGALMFNTGHSGLDLPDYAQRIQRHDFRPLFFLHDLIPVSHPEYCRAGEADRHHRRLEAMLSVGKGLIVNSAATRDELMAYAANRNVNVPPCVVAPLAPATLPAPFHGRPLEKPYFVVLGTIEPRKNHSLLLHLWRQLVENFGDSAPQLVVIGQRGWECEQVVDLLDRCAALQGHVTELPRCGDRELATWLTHAQALLFPSFIEGFGMPLVEALMLGVPVIASDLAVFREIAGDIPHYIDPLDGPGWGRAVLEFVKPDSSERKSQITRMENYTPPSWEQHFAIVEELLRKIDSGG